MKLYSVLLLATAALIATPASARNIKPSTRLASKTITVGSFDELEAGHAHVIVTIGPATGKAKITAPQNLINELEVETSGGDLHIKYPSELKIKGNTRTTVEITAPSLKEIKSKLSAKVEVRGDLATTGDLDLKASTSGTILLGNASTKGNCELKASTSGTISAQDLKAANEAELSATTSGNVKIGILNSKTVDADASTNGGILVKDGSTKTAEFKASTNGSIKASGLRADSGSAKASTSGLIECNVADMQNLKKSTGGSISNNR